MKISKIEKQITLMTGLVLMLPAVSAAQQAAVKGVVRDARSGESLPFANVAFMRARDTVFVRGTSADADGRFSLAAEATDSLLLQASYVGYEPYVEPVRGLAMQADLDIRLRRGTTLKAVSVTADKPLYSMDGEKNMYNAKEDPSVQTGTAADALQNAPGVEVDAEGNITLRGVGSVEIWINDRPSHMNDEALKQYIKTLPANAIERIEVITNPSARYSTTGGVINIVTSQKVTRNELLCLGVRATTMPVVSPWASYVYANERFDINVYLNAGYSQYMSGSDGTSTLLRGPQDTSRFQRYETDTRSRNFNGYSGLNMNWTLSDRTHLATWLGVYPYWVDNRTTSTLYYREYPSTADLGYRYTLDNPDGFGWGGYGGAWLQHQFDTTGRKLSVSLNGNLWNNRGGGNEVFDYADPARDSLQRRSSSRSSAPSASLSVDYTHPLKHGITLEAGLELDFGYTSSSDKLDTLSATGQWRGVPYRSHEARGTTLEPCVYLTAQKRWGGFTAKVGLRYNSNFKTGAVEHPGLADRMELDTLFAGLIPSIHLSYQSKRFDNYSLSYTRRYSYDGDVANYLPFRIFSDYSFRTGNPNLLMCYTHNVEGAWSRFFQHFGTVGLNAYFRANTDEIGSATLAGSAPEYFGTQLVNYTMPVNIGSSHTEGLEANVTYRPSAMVNVRLNASVFNYAYRYDGFSDSRVSWSARLNVWAKVWGWLEVFANAHYASPRLGLYSLTVANKGVDLGVSSDFFDRRLSVFVNVNDVFGMAEWGENTTAPQYQTTGSQHFDSRFVSLGLTWRIGKMQLEGKARQGAADMGTPAM